MEYKRADRRDYLKPVDTSDIWGDDQTGNLYVFADYLEHQIVRDNIIWSLNNDFNTNTITVFSIDNLKYFYEVFMDYKELNSQYPFLKLSYNINIDRKPLEILNINDNNSEIIDSLTKTVQYMTENNFDKSLVCFNNSFTYRIKTLRDKCFYSDIYSGFDVNGDIYPSMTTCFSSPLVKELFKLGNILTDSFDILDQNRNTLMSKLNFNYTEQCMECPAPCSVISWDTIKTDISEFNGMPSEKHCEVHKLINEYLNG